MKNRFLSISVTFSLSLIILGACSSRQEKIKYSTGEWDADSLGYHRIVLHVGKITDAVAAHIEWRRRDKAPEEKGYILIDAASGKRIMNVKSVSISREAGDIIFQPQTVPGDYFLYYLPGKAARKSNYPKVRYPLPFETADSAWISKIMELTGKNFIGFMKLAAARVKAIQSRDEFNSFYPMEVIATKSETVNLINSYMDKDFLIFPEDRLLSIRMKEDLPQKWIEDKPFRQLDGSALRGEYFTFQLGVYPVSKEMKNVQVSFSNLKDGSGKVLIEAGELTCINTGGRNWDNTLFRKSIDIKKSNIQALWCGVMIPEELKKCSLRGTVTVSGEGMKPESVNYRIEVSDKQIINHGDNQPEKMTRLRWLNSEMEFNDDLIKPFTEVKRDKQELSILGRKIILNDLGLPSDYISFFSPDVTALTGEGNKVLSGPMNFAIETADRINLQWKNRALSFDDKSQWIKKWRTENSAGKLEMIVDGSLEADGFASLKIMLIAKEDLTISNTHFYIPIKSEFARYMMGLGLRGGLRPPEHEWKWDRMLHQEGAWIGGVNGGIQYALRDNNYVRPLNTNFYRDKPLIMPVPWFNDGKGGIKITGLANSVLVDNYTGARNMKNGDTLHFYVNFLFTPFKTIETDKQWSTRFYHRYDPIDTIREFGANTINIHHANEINPWINYPFLEPAKMKSYIDKAHQNGMKVKIYNTIRELSNRAPEIFAIRSLGNEVYSTGAGGGFNWLQEHLSDDYIAAWFVPDLKDAAIINSGMSRWHNYYIEGMNWLTKNVGIDGLYLDDVAFDRTTMKRLRKVLDKNRSDALIDLHSANQYNIRDGFTNSANLYMEHFPYLNRLWFGEYFDKNQSPDFWLVEMSGIPFGLMGEMLQDGGNQYRGMLYGMTSRAPWSGDPRPIWKAWDNFGMTGTKMTGYWSASCPVKTNSPAIYASVYSKEGSAMIAVASWDKQPRDVRLIIDWERLGIEKSECTITIPYIKGFQEEMILKPDEPVNIKPSEGRIIIIKSKIDSNK
jgi:hypothetical protein